MEKNQNNDSFIKGLILVANSDIGPQLVSNLSPIDDTNALVTALHMVSLAGLEEDAERDEDASKMIGPLPVKGSSDFKALYYSEVLKASDAEDTRLQEFGAKVGIILIFEKDKLPEIRRASGLIEPYLQRYLSKLTETKELNNKFAIELYEHIVDLVSSPRIRTFTVSEDGIKENVDPGFIQVRDNIMILDEHSKKMYLITRDGISPFLIRKLRQSIDKVNMEMYQGQHQIIVLEKFEDIEPLLLKHGIQTI